MKEVNGSHPGVELHEAHAENQLSPGQGRAARELEHLETESGGSLRAWPTLLSRVGLPSHTLGLKHSSSSHGPQPIVGQFCLLEVSFSSD